MKIKQNIDALIVNQFVLFVLCLWNTRLACRIIVYSNSKAAVCEILSRRLQNRRLRQDSGTKRVIVCVELIKVYFPEMKLNRESLEWCTEFQQLLDWLIPWTNGESGGQLKLQLLQPDWGLCFIVENWGIFNMCYIKLKSIEDWNVEHLELYQLIEQNLRKKRISSQFSAFP